MRSNLTYREFKMVARIIRLLPDTLSDAMRHYIALKFAEEFKLRHKKFDKAGFIHDCLRRDLSNV